MKCTRLRVGALAVSAVISVAAYAQELSGAGEELQEVVVTGTAGGAELRKVEASFAISTGVRRWMIHSFICRAFSDL